MSKGSILIIDDETNLRQLMSRIIELEGYRVLQAENAYVALQLIDQHKEILLVMSDVRLPDINGLKLLPLIKDKLPYCEIVLLTAYGTIQDGVSAIKSGAFDYITKGDHDEQLLLVVDRAIEKARMQKRIMDLETKVNKIYGFDNIIGKSPKITEAIKLAHRVAPTDATVLLEGETGTGKEIFAEAIHYASPRKTKPFVAVNCSAFPNELLESEVFGYKTGAFTGATRDKKGLFEEAHEGTIFLDEIGEMNIDLQAKFLRFIETKSFIKLGETRPTKIDTRIIAATNKNLEHECLKGNFRKDLYYRLSTFQIILPPLKERIEDIEAFTSYFIQQFSLKVKKKITAATPQFIEKLKKHPWDGNIRELRNVVERAVIISDDETLHADLLPFSTEQDFLNLAEKSQILPLDELEKNYITKVLEFTEGNKQEASKLLGIGLTTLYRKISEHQL
jgi:two-component system, NtrC family, response regulator